MAIDNVSEWRLKTSLLLLRWGVFIVFFMWTIDKFINPEHAAAVFEKFYFIEGLSNILAYAIGAVQLVVVLSFVLGFKKRISYGIVFILHFASTVLSYERYLDPWTSPNLLFFAAWPMLAAIFVLYLLRDQDTLMTIEK